MEEGKPLTPILQPLFFEKQVTAWGGDPNAGKTSMAMALSFLAAFKIENPYFYPTEELIVFVGFIRNRVAPRVMAMRALKIRHEISDAQLSQRFHIIAARHPDNKGAVNPAKSEFAQTIVDDILKAKDRLTAPVKLIVLDGFLFLSDEEQKEDKQMAAIMHNIRALADTSSLDPAILILCNQLKKHTRHTRLTGV